MDPVEFVKTHLGQGMEDWQEHCLREMTPVEPPAVARDNVLTLAKMREAVALLKAQAIPGPWVANYYKFIWVKRRVGRKFYKKWIPVLCHKEFS